MSQIAAVGCPDPCAVHIVSSQYMEYIYLAQVLLPLFIVPEQVNMVQVWNCFSLNIKPQINDLDLYHLSK